MEGFTEKVVAEFSKLQLVEEKWENLDPTLCFKWVEDQPAPFSNHEVEIDLNREQIKELACLLNEFIERAKPIR